MLSLLKSTVFVKSQEVKSDEPFQMTLTKPLPDDVTPDQKEKFLALMAHYSDILADSPNKLGHTGILKHSIDTGMPHPSVSKPGEYLFLAEKLCTIYCRTCYLKILYHHHRALGLHQLC